MQKLSFLGYVRTLKSFRWMSLLCILLCFRTSLQQIQISDIDDIYKIDIFQINLPDTYEQQQSGYIPLHPLSMQFERQFTHQTNSEIYEAVSKMLRISAYYFSKIIQVETISPQQQTLFKAFTTGLGQQFCRHIQVPQIFRTFGFNATLTDIVIFVEIVDTSTMSGVCVLQRRPTYGIMSLQKSFYTQNTNKKFHIGTVRIIHHLFHILGFNSFLMFGQVQFDTFWTIIGNNINQLPYSGRSTHFYQDSYSKQKKLWEQVVKQSQWKKQQFVFVGKNVLKWYQQTFGCQQQGQGPNFFSALVYGYTCQFCSFFHWSFEYKHDFMSINHFNSQEQQHTKILPLSLHFLKDTGYYQFVDVAQVDNFNLGRQQKGCRYLQAVTTADICYQPTAFQCDPIGIFYQVREFEYDSTRQKKCRLQSASCQEYSQNKRCFKTWTQQFPDFCLNTACQGYGSQLHLKIVVQNMEITACYPGETQYYIPRLNRTIQCPKNMDSFCSVKYCSDYCNFAGLCIDGKCIIPPDSFQSSLIQSNPIFAQCTNSSSQIISVLCPLGCSYCKCQFSGSQLSIMCYQTQYGFSKYQPSTISTQQVVLCKYGCQACPNKGQSCLGCFKNYFLGQSGVCSPCDSSCSSCQIGDNIGTIECTNCRQGQFIDFQGRCSACQIKNCLKCISSQECQTCKTGYSLGKNQNQCVECLPSCSVCSQNDISKCEGCRSGFYFNNLTSKCVSCSYGCKSCDSQSFCTLCFEQWSLNQGNACTLKCKAPCLKCLQSSSTKCTSCPIGYTLDQATSSCSVDISCNINNMCQYCPIGYVLDQSRNYCQKCSIQNCGQCKINSYETYCAKCLPGYYRDIFQQCSKCPSQCNQCFQADVCLKCQDGYSHPKNIDGSLQKQVCQKCIDNCALCPASPNECIRCVQNFHLLGWKCVPNKNLNYTVTIQYSRNLSFFIQEIQFKQLQTAIRKAYNIPSQYLHTFIQFSEGPLIAKGQIGYPQSSYTVLEEQECAMYAYLAQNMKSQSFAQGYKILRAQLSASNVVCYTYQLNKQLVIIQNIDGLDVGILLLILAGIILIFIIIIAVIGYRLTRKVQRLILKFQALKSKQQYQSTSSLVKQKEAF